MAADGEGRWRCARGGGATWALLHVERGNGASNQRTGHTCTGEHHPTTPAFLPCLPTPSPWQPQRDCPPPRPLPQGGRPAAQRPRVHRLHDAERVQGERGGTAAVGAYANVAAPVRASLPVQRGGGCVCVCVSALGPTVRHPSHASSLAGCPHGRLPLRRLPPLRGAHVSKGVLAGMGAGRAWARPAWWPAALAGGRHKKALQARSLRSLGSQLMMQCKSSHTQPVCFSCFSSPQAQRQR